MYNRNRIIRDVPYLSWVFALGLICFAIYRYIVAPKVLMMPLVLGGLGLLVVVISSILNVYIDRSRRVLEVERLSLFGRKRIEVQVDKIESIFVERRVKDDDDGGTSRTYRVVLVLDTGEQVPLRNSSSSAKRKHQAHAEAIREAIGLDTVVQSPESMGEMMSMAFQMMPKEDHQAKTGIAPGEHESNGIRWQMETFNYAGAAQQSEIYRWSTYDVDTPTDFVFIVQKMEGAGEQRALIKVAGKFLFKTSLQLYGFDESYAPGLDQARTVDDVDKRLVDNYFVYTNNPGLARQLLNPWVVAPLISWSERYELSPKDKEMRQLSVLFSPLGLYVSLNGKLDQAEIDELVGLGVELARSK